MVGFFEANCCQQLYQDESLAVLASYRHQSSGATELKKCYEAKVLLHTGAEQFKNINSCVNAVLKLMVFVERDMARCFIFTLRMSSETTI